MILVTGGTGFIGGALIRRLVELDYPVRTLVRPSVKSPNLPRGVAVDVAVSSLTDERGLRAAMVGVDTVYHLASGEWHGPKASLMQIDIQGTRAVVDAARDAGVQRIFYLSHLGADRASAYSVLKAKGIAEEFIRRSGIDYTIIRSAIVYGPGDGFTSGIARILGGLPWIFLMPGDGKVQLQPLWIEDLVTGLSWAIDDPDTHNRTIEIGGPEYLTFRQIVDEVMLQTGQRRMIVNISPAYLRLITVFLESLFANLPVTIYWLDYLAVNRTTALDTMPRLFDLMPSRYSQRLSYLQSEDWRKSLLRSLFSRKKEHETNRMNDQSQNDTIEIHILETPQQAGWVEDLQRLVWPGSDTEIVPAHVMLTAAHNGGVLIGAFDTQSDGAERQNIPFLPSGLVGFVFGFPGLYQTPDGPRLKHCSHMLGVHPAYQDRGIGFRLKRAQWQMVRKQSIDLITWTYDPLLSRNARLNITNLGGVCNTFLPNEYGELRDGLNAGQPTDRFQIDWWVESKRVASRLSNTKRGSLDLAHFLAAGVPIANPTQLNPAGLPVAPDQANLPDPAGEKPALLLVEIPADYQALKNADMNLALAWRRHSQAVFETLFFAGYLVTDFVYLPGATPRSFYLLSQGDSTL